MPIFSCAQGVCLSCNVSSVRTLFNTTLGMTASQWLGNATLIALDPGSKEAYGGCSINPSQCTRPDLLFERWDPTVEGCQPLLGGAKSVRCAAGRAAPALLAACLGLLLLLALLG